MAKGSNNNPSAVRTVLYLAVLLGSMISISTPAMAVPLEEMSLDEVTYKITGDVYSGNKDSFKNPCVLDRKKVFAKIPAIQTIKREKLEKNSARYTFLLQQANKVFRETVSDVASDKGYDLAVEQGGIKATEKGVRIPDITKAVIKALPSS